MNQTNPARRCIGKVCVMMTDGRQLFGVLRVFDQYGSIVIQDTFERIYLPDNRYGEEYIGDLLIRGENLLMIGDLDIDKEDEPIDKLERIPFDDAKREQKQISVNAVKIHKHKSSSLHKYGKVTESFVEF